MRMSSCQLSWITILALGAGLSIAGCTCGESDYSGVGTPPSPDAGDAGDQTDSDSSFEDVSEAGGDSEDVSDALPDIDGDSGDADANGGSGGDDGSAGDSGEDAGLDADAQSDGQADGAEDAPPDVAFDVAWDALPDVADDGPAPDAQALVCTTCHGDPSIYDPAPPPDVSGDTATSDRGVGAHRAHRKSAMADQKIPHGPIACQSCHRVPGDINEAGHLDSTPGAEVHWSGLAIAGGATPSAWKSNVDTSCTGVYCHGATLNGGANPNPVWTTPGGAACGDCHSVPPGDCHPANVKCDQCHGDVIESCPDNDPSHCVFQPDTGSTKSYKLHINGKLEVSTSPGPDGPCSTCHGAPPPNGAHAIHVLPADPPTEYGSLEPLAGATTYGLNCGYCHPLDVSKHMNCELEVELYNPAAPLPPTNPNDPGNRKAIKSQNPAAAYTPGTQTFQGTIHSFTDGTCAVYCHSEQVENSTNIPYPPYQYPLVFQWQSVDAFMNESANTCCNGTVDSYTDFTIQVARVYRSPKWVGETHSGADKCAFCHGYPPRNASPANEGMAGDSHAWTEPQSWGGYEDGHFWNMAQGWPIQCARCHYSTVQNDLPTPGGWHYISPTDHISFDLPMEIANFANHVNGKKDVAFRYSPADCSPANPDLQYRSGGSLATTCLISATYDPATRSCTNVECHKQQTQVTWGNPYRGFGSSTECNACHQM